MAKKKSPEETINQEVQQTQDYMSQASQLFREAWELQKQVPIAILDTAESKIISLMRKDENWQVRMAVVNVCDMEGLEELCMDKNYLVRKNAWMKKEALKEKE